MSTHLSSIEDTIPLLNAKLINRASQKPLYEGSGYVKREDKSFSIHCVCPVVHGDPFSWINNAPPSGTLLGDENLYDLVANMPNGDLFVAERVHPNTTQRSSGCCEICTRSRNIWISDLYPVPEHTHSMTVYFDLVNTNHYQHPIPPVDGMKCPLYEFIHQRINQDGRLYKVSFDKEQTTIQVRAEKTLNINDTIQDLQNVLSFAFFTPVYFHTARFASDNKACIAYSAGSTPVQAHPICGSPTQPGYSNRNIYNLISATLSSIPKQSSTFGDLLIHASLISAHRRSHIEELAFTSCKALEYAVNRDQYALTTTGNQDLNQECDSIKHLLNEQEHPLMYKRIIGLLDSAALESTNARIKRLENESLIPNGASSAFKNVRHKIAHGHLLKQNEIDRAFWDTHKVIDSFNRLLLRESGYKGPITVYAEPGWPITYMQ